MLTAPLGLVSSANLLRMHSIPQSVSLMKILNSTGPNMDRVSVFRVSVFHLYSEETYRELHCNLQAGVELELRYLDFYFKDHNQLLKV